MDAISAIGLSGLTTASTRLQVSASNLANMDDTASPAFVPTKAATVSLPQGGVQAQLSPAQTGTEVDPASEAVDQVSALQQYRASAALVAVDEKMKKSAIDLLG